MLARCNAFLRMICLLYVNIIYLFIFVAANITAVIVQQYVLAFWVIIFYAISGRFSFNWQASSPQHHLCVLITYRTFDIYVVKSLD